MPSDSPRQSPLPAFRSALPITPRPRFGNLGTQAACIDQEVNRIPVPPLDCSRVDLGSARRANSPRKPLTPKFGTPRPDSPRSAAGMREMDRVRGMMGAAVEAPLRCQCAAPPAAAQNPAKLAADALAAAHKKKAAARLQSAEELKAKQAKANFAAKMRRDKESKERELARKKVSAAANAKAKREAEVAQETERRKRTADEVEMRERMRKVLEEQGAAAAKRMRDRWQQQQQPHSERARRAPDPYAEWRGSKEAPADTDDDDDDEEDIVDLSDMSDAEVEQARARKAKERERDAAARRILAHSSKTLMQALGLADEATDGDVAKAVRRALMLLHPDCSINLGMDEGSRKMRRIEAAFKRLNGLRDEDSIC